MSIDNVILPKIFKSPKKIKVVLYDISDAIDFRLWLKKNNRDYNLYKSFWKKNKYIFKIHGGENA